jgi:hypothetical protein
VLFDDLADIAEMAPQGITIPENAGFIVMFSVGWRKALIFDFRPVLPSGTPRPWNIRQLLGGLYAYLVSRNRFILTEHEWNLLFDLKWFPFAGLPTSIIDEMVEHARAGWSVDELQSKIVTAVKQDLPSLRKFVESGDIFSRHRKILLDALSAFERGEYALAVSALFPRIEGLLREHHAIRGTGKATFASISDTAAAAAHNRTIRLGRRPRGETLAPMGPRTYEASAQELRLSTEHSGRLSSSFTNNFECLMKPSVLI